MIERPSDMPRSGAVWVYRDAVKMVGPAEMFRLAIESALQTAGLGADDDYKIQVAVVEIIPTDD